MGAGEAFMGQSPRGGLKSHGAPTHMGAGDTFLGQSPEQA